MKPGVEPFEERCLLSTLTLPQTKEYTIAATIPDVYYNTIEETDRELSVGNAEGTLDGTALTQAYSVTVDLSRTAYDTFNNATVTSNGQVYGYAVLNAPAVAWLLTNLAPKAVSYVQQAALQAAIWRTEYGGFFQLDGIDNSSYLGYVNASIARFYTADLAALGNHTAWVGSVTWITPGNNAYGDPNEGLAALKAGPGVSLKLAQTNFSPITVTVGLNLPDGNVVQRQNQVIGAGDFQGTLGGQTLAGTYCVSTDLTTNTPVSFSHAALTRNGAVYQTPVPNAGRIAWLVQNIGPTATTPDEQAALQAAIWHVEYGDLFQLDGFDNSYSKGDNATIGPIYQSDLFASNGQSDPPYDVDWATPGANPDTTPSQGFVCLPTTPPPPPQIAMLAAALSSDGTEVVSAYAIVNYPLPAPGVMNFYWASGPSVNDKLESQPVYQLATQEDIGTDTVITPRGDFGQRPQDGAYIVAQIVSQQVDPLRDSASVAIPSPRLSASIDTSLMHGIHRILYRGQTLAVPVVLSNSGNAAATGNINVSFYLSQNNQASANGDTILKTYNNQALNVGVGRSQTLQLASTRAIPTVAIPMNLAVGTWYVKAVISAGAQNPAPIPNGQIVVISPALKEVDPTSTMLVVKPHRTYSPSRAFEEGVSQAKASPNFVPPQFQSGYTDANISAYIKSNEGWLNGPYLDSENVPTIGWGFALQDKNQQGALVDDATAVAQFDALDATFARTNHIGWIDPRTGGHMTFADLVQLAGVNGVYTGGALRYTIPDFTQAAAGPWWTAEYTIHRDGVITNWNASPQATVKFATLTPRIQAVLIDMSYNMGTNYISLFPNMVRFISAGGTNIAYGAFEMMNSDYSTQVPQRAIRNFRLLVGGYEIDL
jgi:GH24 family phage-related lysozyme (muramidase)